MYEPGLVAVLKAQAGTKCSMTVSSVRAPVRFRRRRLEISSGFIVHPFDVSFVGSLLTQGFPAPHAHSLLHSEAIMPVAS